MEKQKRKKNPLQFLQFSVIGIANAGIDIGTLNLLLFLFQTEEKGLLILYNTIAYTLAVLNSYFWNASITFKKTAIGNNQQRVKFIVQALVSLGVNNLVFIVSTMLLETLGTPKWLHYNVAKGLAMFFSFITSFIMIKYYVFKQPRKQ